MKKFFKYTKFLPLVVVGILSVGFSLQAAVTAPTVTLSATQETITAGDSTTISWTSSNATSCLSDWASSSATAGSRTVTPPIAQGVYTYSITCSKGAAEASDSIDIVVNAVAVQPTASLYNISPANQTITPKSLPVSASFNWSGANYTMSFYVSVSGPQGSQTLSSISGPNSTYPPTAVEPYNYSGSYNFSTPGTYTITYYGLAKTTAQSAADEVSESRTITVANTPPQARPESPGSFVATPISCSQISLSWANAAGATAYTLKRGSTTIYTGSATSFVDSGLNFSTSYSYSIIASNNIGDAPAVSASASTPTCVTLDLSVNSSSGPTVFINNGDPFYWSWSSSGATTCTILSPASGGVPLSGTSGIVNQGHPYYPTQGGSTIVSLQCSNGSQTVQKSITVQLPGPSLNLQVNEITAPGVLQLDQNQAYTYTWSSSNTSSCSLLAPVVSGIPTSGGPSTVSPGSSQYPSSANSKFVTIQCSNAQGVTVTKSVEVKAYSAPQNTTPTGTISNVVPSSNITISKGTTLNLSADFFWTNAPYRRSFDISVTKPNSQTTIEASWTNAYPQSAIEAVTTATNYTFNTVGTYTVRYHGLAKYGEFGPAAEPNAYRTITVTDGANARPETPSSFTATAATCGTGQIYLVWGSSGGATGYTLKKNGSTIYSGPALSYTDSGLPSSTNYTYTVYASNNAGSSAEASASATSPVSPCPPPPIDEPPPAQQVTATLSANPATITQGNSSTLTWNSTNATYCTGSWAGQTLSTSGSTSVSPQTSNTYNLGCYNNTSSASAQASVTVNPVQLVADTIIVNSNMPTTWTLYESYYNRDAFKAYTSQGTATTRTYQVDPGPQGALYSINAASKDGYSTYITNTVTGEGSAFSMWRGRGATININYSQVAPFGYTLSNAGTVNVGKGSQDAYAQTTITKNLTQGVTQPVDITLSGVPNGVTYSIANRNCSPTCTSTITFTVSPGTAVGTHRITVTGAPNNVQTSFDLVVTASRMRVSCVPSPAVAEVGQPVTWTAVVEGGTSPYTYEWSGNGIPTNPAPSTNPYVVTYSTLGEKNAQVTVRDSQRESESCSADSSVQVNFNPKFEEF